MVPVSILVYTFLLLSAAYCPRVCYSAFIPNSGNLQILSSLIKSNTVPYVSARCSPACRPAILLTAVAATTTLPHLDQPVELRDAVGHFARAIAPVWASHAEILPSNARTSGMFVEVSEKTVYVLVRAAPSPAITAQPSSKAGAGSDLFWKVHCAGRRADVGHAALLLHLRGCYPSLAVGGVPVTSIGLVRGRVPVDGARTLKSAAIPAPASHTCDNASRTPIARCGAVCRSCNAQPQTFAVAFHFSPRRILSHCLSPSRTTISFLK
jgi:hypothetical protein